MKRRSFVLAGAASVLGAATFTRNSFAGADPFDPRPGPWREFSVTTTVRLQAGDAAQAWVPVPSFAESSWMRPGKSSWTGDASHAQLVTVEPWNAQLLYAEWPAGSQPRTLVVTSLVSTRDLAVNLSQSVAHEPLSDADRDLYTRPTTFIPTDGIVKQTADQITANASTDVEKAHRIYEWIVEHTYRNPKTRGCGLGNVSFLLQTGDLGGKCADINGLAVGLARAAGLPARDLYGIRVAPSRFGYKSLGANSPTISKSQHCRAEIYLADFGWTPLDPADVRKVMLEEPPGDLSPQNPKVQDARETLFGAWEGNYMAYNDAHDVALPGSQGQPLPFVMYPQAEISGKRLDSLDAGTFVYEITVA